MLGLMLVALAQVQAPQDTATLDAPAYVNQAYGVSIPRPFDDWVFEPGTGPEMTTVIFHPRGAPLREQLWGALLLTRFAEPVPLRPVVERRLRSTWPGLLGGSFTRMASESVEVAGLPAIRTAMSGAIGGVALDVEEYAVARGNELLLLQFRIPRGLPPDSVSAGYRRTIEGLRIQPGTVSRLVQAAAPAPPAWIATPAGLPTSAWQAAGYDALVRYDTAALRADVAATVELLNAGTELADSVSLWLWPGLVLDSVHDAAGPVSPVPFREASRVGLSAAVPPGQETRITVFYHASGVDWPLPPRQMNLSPTGMFAATDWLPRVQPEVDSAGQLREDRRPDLTLRLDVPEHWKAVAQGRLTSDLASRGRRRMTWQMDQVMPAVAAFALGPYQVLTRNEGPVTVSVWITPADSPSSAAIDTLAAAVGEAWTFCSQAFGRLPIRSINVAVTDVPDVRGFAGLLLLDRAALGAAGGGGGLPSLATLVREIARTWWGNSVMADGPGSSWIVESFPAWAAVAAGGAWQGDSVRRRLTYEADSAWRAEPASSRERPLASVPAFPADPVLTTKGVVAIEAARRASGEAAFREAALVLAREHRNAWLRLSDVLAAFGPAASAALRPYLF